MRSTCFSPNHQIDTVSGWNYKKEHEREILWCFLKKNRCVKKSATAIAAAAGCGVLFSKENAHLFKFTHFLEYLQVQLMRWCTKIDKYEVCYHHHHHHHGVVLMETRRLCVNCGRVYQPSQLGRQGRFSQEQNVSNSPNKQILSS